MTGVTASGFHLGRIKDRADSRDHLFKLAQPHALLAPLPPRVSLRSRMPPVWNQGDMQSCGGHLGAGIMGFFFPAKPAFSRLQLYYGGRSILGKVDEDSGVETRDIFRVMQLTGAAPEALWPYDKAHLMAEPTAAVYDAAEQCTINTFSRLEAENEILACLAQEFPIGLGIELFESVDSPELARTGVMPMPDMTREQVIGGHDVVIIGYDLDFKNSEIFKKSGVDPALVSDHTLEIRNSWSEGFGDKGHIWMPMAYATDIRLGNDAWTARL